MLRRFGSKFLQNSLLLTLSGLYSTAALHAQQPAVNPAPIPLNPSQKAAAIAGNVQGKALIQQATALLKSGQLDSAIPILQRASVLRYVDPTSHFYLGLVYDQKGMSQMALENYTLAIKRANALGMDSAQLRINLGNTLCKLNFLKEAEFDYKRAIEIDDKNDVAHLNLGRVLLFKGDNQGAFRELSRASALMATDPNLPLYQALALKGMGNNEECKNQLQIFLDRAAGTHSDPRVISMAQNLLAELK
ncbi:MAG: tetratricopeptide repeat protein [Leptolyngbya sp.]|nr:tetratricopeptide repeat protein [Candidatus Melainabacteria bacterium]